MSEPLVVPTSRVGDSPRVRLAHLALGAALNVAGVYGADSGPHGVFLTGDPPTGALRGVSVIAQADGRYSVDLCLVAGIVPLIDLAREVRRRVQARVALDGLGGQLGDVNVQFGEVLSAEEIAQQARERAAQAVGQAVAAHRGQELDPPHDSEPEERLP